MNSMSMHSLFERELVSTTTELAKLITNINLSDRKTEEPTCFVDVKFEGLRDILRAVLKSVNGICLREDKPTVFHSPLTTQLPR